MFLSEIEAVLLRRKTAQKMAPPLKNYEYLILIIIIKVLCNRKEVLAFETKQNMLLLILECKSIIQKQDCRSNKVRKNELILKHHFQICLSSID